MKMAWLASWLVMGALGIVACGGDDDGPAPGTDSGVITVDGGGGGDAAGIDGGGADDAGPSAVCPAALPTDGSACDDDGRQCQYGADPRLRCRPVARCTGGTWSVTDPMCPDPPTATCPPTREDADGEGCTPDGAICDYDGLACTCTNCVDGPAVMCGGPLMWQCAAPNTMEGCPAAAPNAGTACAEDGLFCSYGCDTDMSRRCDAGSWVLDSAPGGCPISTRSSKTAIDYLDDDERQRVADELLGTRLATWQYRRTDGPDRPRLGFIIEDQRDGSWAVDPERDMVDLYGYASMLVATVQQQQRQIERLEHEVRALRRR